MESIRNYGQYQVHFSYCFQDITTVFTVFTENKADYSYHRIIKPQLNTLIFGTPI